MTRRRCLIHAPCDAAEPDADDGTRVSSPTFSVLLAESALPSAWLEVPAWACRHVGQIRDLRSCVFGEDLAELLLGEIECVRLGCELLSVGFRGSDGAGSHLV